MVIVGGVPQSEEIHEAMSAKRHSLKMMADDCGINVVPLLFAFYDEIAKLSQDELIAYMGDIGEKLLAPKREKITLAAQRATMEQLPEIPHKDQPKPYWQAIPIVRCKKDGTEDRLVSDICAKLYNEYYPDYQFVCCITSDGKYSLRSNKNGSNYDVSLIAKFYGGGGHRNAAGFSV